MPFVESNSGKIFYTIRGSGQPIIIIKGMLFSSKHWLGFEKTLSQYFSVITMDNRGIGRSQIKASWNLTPFHMSDDVADVIHHLKLQRAHIMGVSLGGMATLATGIKYPEICHSLTLINSSIGGGKWPRLSPNAALKLMLAGGFNQRTHAALRDLLLHRDTPFHRKTSVMDSWVRIQQEDGWPRLTTAKQAIAALRFRPTTQQLASLATPTHIIYGDGDRFVPNYNSFHLYNQIPHATITKMEGVGHEIELDNPKLLALTLQDLLLKP